MLFDLKCFYCKEAVWYRYNIYIKILYYFNMAKIYAGTGYNQLIAFNSSAKSKQKIVYGPLSKNIVHNIT
jgi:hypothetical protein